MQQHKQHVSCAAACFHLTLLHGEKDSCFPSYFEAISTLTFLKKEWDMSLEILF